MDTGASQSGDTPLYGLYRPGICGPKVYGLGAILIINMVSILAILVSNRVQFFCL